MRRLQRVPERPEPNRDGHGPLLPVSPCEAIGVRKKGEMESRQEAPLAEEPRISSLSSISTVSNLTEPGAKRTSCPRQKRNREGGEGGELKGGAFPCAVKWPEAEERQRRRPDGEPRSARQWQRRGEFA